MKKILILTASPRKNGNTNSLVKAFTAGLDAQTQAGDVACEVIDLCDLDIRPCIACRCCQTEWDEWFCVQEDALTGFDGASSEAGAEPLFDKIMAADAIILATPVYSWYCTAPMKALLDRCVYALNKYYDDAAGTHRGARGPSLWAGKKVALITTCGYEPEKGADLLQEGVRRFCKHSQLEFIGSLVERHMGYKTEFMDEEKETHAKAFAEEVAQHCI